MSRCDLCGNAPRWIYRVGKDEICGACCANRLAAARAENAKLLELVQYVASSACGHIDCDCVGCNAERLLKEIGEQ